MLVQWLANGFFGAPGMWFSYNVYLYVYIYICIIISISQKIPMTTPWLFMMLSMVAKMGNLTFRGYTYIYISIHILYTYTHIHMYTYTHIHIYSHTHTHIYTYPHIHMTYMCMYVYILYIHAYTTGLHQMVLIHFLGPPSWTPSELPRRWRGRWPLGGAKAFRCRAAQSGASWGPFWIGKSGTDPKNLSFV